MIGWSERKQKSKVREYQINIPGPPRKTCIFFPGWDSNTNTGGLCIKNALSFGIINYNTQIIAIEKNPKLFDDIELLLLSFNFNKKPIFFKGDLCNLKLNMNIDYANFDFLGTLNENLTNWFLIYFNGRIEENASVSFTFTKYWRNNPFMSKCDRLFKRLNIRDKVWAAVHHYEITDWNELLHLLILKSIFYNFDFEYRIAHIYRDNVQTMCAYRLDHFHKKETGWPSLTEVFLDKIS